MLEKAWRQQNQWKNLAHCKQNTFLDHLCTYPNVDTQQPHNPPMQRGKVMSRKEENYKNNDSLIDRHNYWLKEEKNRFCIVEFIFEKTVTHSTDNGDRNSLYKHYMLNNVRRVVNDKGGMYNNTLIYKGNFERVLFAAEELLSLIHIWRCRRRG